MNSLSREVSESRFIIFPSIRTTRKNHVDPKSFSDLTLGLPPFRNVENKCRKQKLTKLSSTLLCQPQTYTRSFKITQNNKHRYT